MTTKNIDEKTREAGRKNFEAWAEEKMAKYNLDSFWMDTMMDFFGVGDSREITEEMKKEFHDIFTTPFAAEGNIYTGREEF